MNQSFGSSQISNFEKKEIIGKGAYGEVYKAVDRRTKETVALKKILIEMDAEGFPSSSIRQISLLREINHKNIVSYQRKLRRLLDVIIDQKRLYLVFEYGDCDLKSYLEKLAPSAFIQPVRVKKYLYQLLSGIADCHIKRIIHRDLKTANLLLDRNGNHWRHSDNIKIADFGLARTYSVPVRPYSHEVVTLWYRAPEILLGSAEYSTPIDIWAIGCIFAEMITKRPLFEGDSEIDQLYRIFRVLGTPNETNWPGVSQLKDYKSTFPNWLPSSMESVVNNLNIDKQGLDLLKSMLIYDPNQRITARHALKHPYFKDVQSP